MYKGCIIITNRLATILDGSKELKTCFTLPEKSDEKIAYVISKFISSYIDCKEIKVHKMKDLKTEFPSKQTYSVTLRNINNNNTGNNAVESVIGSLINATLKTADITIATMTDNTQRFIVTVEEQECKSIFDRIENIINRCEEMLKNFFNFKSAKGNKK